MGWQTHTCRASAVPPPDESRSKKETKAFAAEILASNDDGTFDVRYRDGDVERSVPAAWMTLLPGGACAVAAGDCVEAICDYLALIEAALAQQVVESAPPRLRQELDAVARGGARGRR